MTHDAYSTKRVTVWPERRNGEEGYAVKYQDGYISWCPKAVYERDYQPITAMGFSGALHALKQGKKVARREWSFYMADAYLKGCHKEGEEAISSFLLLKVPTRVANAALGISEAFTDKYFDPEELTVKAWHPKDEDIFAEDWFIVGEV